MRLLMKKIVASAAIIATTGCSTSSGLAPKTSYSGFDNSKTVSIAPHGNACKTMTCTGIGAQWTAAKPDSAIIIITVFNDYEAITGAEFAIDGEKITLQPANNITDFSEFEAPIKLSTKGYTASLTTINKILSSKRAWLRVHTPTGYIEDPIISDGKDSKAYHALKRFMDTINQ